MGRQLILCLIVCVLIAGPALAAKSFVDFEETFDFSGFKRYQWRTHPVMEANPALAQTAIAGDIVMSEGNEILMGRGYEPVEFEPDFYIAFYVTGKEGMTATTYGSSWYSNTAWTSSTNTIVRNFVDGTLVIDIVDAKSTELVWRASYSDKVSNWKKRHKVISKAVQKAFKKFPPK